MTREEIEGLKGLAASMGLYDDKNPCKKAVILGKAIEELEQEPKFIVKSDGTIEPIKNCNDCLFKKEWEKIGKLLLVVLEKQTEQEPILDKIRAESDGKHGRY